MRTINAIHFKLYDYGNYIGDYTAIEISSMIGIRSKVVSNYADNEKTYKKRYTFHRLSDNEANGWLFEWSSQWDATRKKVLKALREN